MYTATKSFEFAAAHRVRNQILHGDMCEGQRRTKAKCRRIHGHNNLVEITLKSDRLIDDMVLDFNMFGFFKDIVDNYLDHHLILDKDDVTGKIIIDALMHQVEISEDHPKISLEPSAKLSTPDFEAWTVNMDLRPEQLEDSTARSCAEVLDGVTMVSFVTTSENFAKWIAQIFQKKLNEYNNTHYLDIKVHSVRYSESGKNCAEYLAEE